MQFVKVKVPRSLKDHSRTLLVKCAATAGVRLHVDRTAHEIFSGLNTGQVMMFVIREVYGVGRRRLGRVHRRRRGGRSFSSRPHRRRR